MIIFDVIIGGNKVEELYPKTSSIKDLRTYIEQKMYDLQEKYGSEVYLSRRFEYK